MKDDFFLKKKITNKPLVYCCVVFAVRIEWLNSDYSLKRMENEKILTKKNADGMG